VETELNSPRTPIWRRLLWASGPIVLAVGILVFLVAHFRNPGDNTTPLPVSPNSTIGNKVDQRLDNEARQVAGKFILTAVAGHNVGASFDLVAPSFKQTWWACKKCDKQEWARGPIPIVPAGFPIKALDQVRFTVKERGPNWMTIDVALVPKTGKRAEVFKLGLSRASKTKPWLVDYWMTAEIPGVHANPNN
jgi:hypothetical protein